MATPSHLAAFSLRDLARRCLAPGVDVVAVAATLHAAARWNLLPPPTPGDLDRTVLAAKVELATSSRPVTVVQDAPEVIALWLHQGTRWQRCTPSAPDGDLVACKAGLAPWHLAPATWPFENTLLLMRPGDAHATHLMWDAAHAFQGWYINLQEPLRRTSLGFDFLDHELDLVVAPDRTWRWKDAEHLAQAEAIGLFTPAQSATIRAEGQRVIAQLESAQPPFDHTWLNWRPPAAWAVPTLPSGWEVFPVPPE